MTRHRHPWLRRASRVAFYVFLAVVAWLLVRAARAIDWGEVRMALAALDAATLGAALALTAVSYAVYACYDLAARAYAGHAVRATRVLTIAATAYAFALSIGALVGGAGFRFRMYGREGVPLGQVARVVLFAAATNWIGYLALAGALFVSGRVVLPASLPLAGLDGATAMRTLGLAMLALVVAYVIACHATHGRIFHVRGHHFRLPAPKLAVLQVALAATNWWLMGQVLARFLPQAGDAVVLAALLVSAVATAAAHIPAGVGVLEAVFIAMLGHRVPAPHLIAALLAYRACYYLVPLAIASAAFAALELSGRKSRPAALPSVTVGPEDNGTHDGRQRAGHPPPHRR